MKRRARHKQAIALEHRDEETRKHPRHRRPFKETLRAIPNAGKDSDFEREPQMDRPVHV